MRAGDVVWNPLTGEKALLIESAEESGGARMVVDFAVEEGGFVPGGAHAHDNCAEHFEVREGRITIVIDDQERTLGPGEQIAVPRGAMHRWWNSGEGQVLARVRIEPALRFQEAIMVLWDCAPTAIPTRRGCPRRCWVRCSQRASGMRSGSESRLKSSSESCSPRWLRLPG